MLPLVLITRNVQRSALHISLLLLAVFFGGPVPYRKPFTKDLDVTAAFVVYFNFEHWKELELINISYLLANFKQIVL